MSLLIMIYRASKLQRMTSAQTSAQILEALRGAGLPFIAEE